MALTVRYHVRLKMDILALHGVSRWHAIHGVEPTHALHACVLTVLHHPVPVGMDLRWW